MTISYFFLGFFFVGPGCNGEIPSISVNFCEVSLWRKPDAGQGLLRRGSEKALPRFRTAGISYQALDVSWITYTCKCTYSLYIVLYLTGYVGISSIRITFKSFFFFLFIQLIAMFVQQAVVILDHWHCLSILSYICGELSAMWSLTSVPDLCSLLVSAICWAVLISMARYIEPGFEFALSIVKLLCQYRHPLIQYGQNIYIFLSVFI